MDLSEDQFHQQQQQQGSLSPPPPAHHAAQTQQHRPFNPPQPHQQQQQSSSPTSTYPYQHQSQLPQQPQSHQQSHHQPRPSQSSTKSRGFSFHSHDRKNSYDKEYLQETAEEKEARRPHGKADPTLAISEAEPAEIAAMTETSLAPLRSIVHKDATGNPIVDPDKSNPTRSRWERPLDTIRGFEAAIEGGYSRKSMMMRADTDSVVNWNRRQSYYQPGPGQQPRTRPDSFYGSRPVSMMRPDAQYDYNGAGPSRNSIYEGQGYNNGHGNGGYGYQGGRQRPNRQYSQYSEAPNYNVYGRDQYGYQLSHKDRSYETVTSAAASGGSDPAGYQTDPTSSDNSSIERRSPNKRLEPMNDYGIGFGQSQGAPDSNLGAGLGPRDHHPLPPPPTESPYPVQSAMRIPRKEAPTLLRRQPTQQSVAAAAAAPEKRKSWFMRRFSKNS